MKTETLFRKDFRKAWRAESRVRLGVDETDPAKPARWQLDITTSKNDRGELVSSASVAKIDGGFATHRMFADYSRNIFRRTARCTEKNIEAQHNEALAMLETVLADVRDHYARAGETIPMPDQTTVTV